MASNNRSPRVFVTQEPRENRQGWTPDLKPAEKFGALTFVFAQQDCPSFGPDSAIFQAAEALDSFDAERDFLLSPNFGDPASTATCLLVLARRSNINRIKLLVWDKSRNARHNSGKGIYRVVHFTLPSAD